jgi:hypothetical protein
MSTLRVTNLQSAAGTQNVTQDRLYRGAATAWVNFNGTGTVAIRDSYNVSSITDNGVGDYTVNFQTALADANYCVQTTGDNADCATGANYLNSQAAGSVRVWQFLSDTNTYADATFFNATIFGGY